MKYPRTNNAYHKSRGDNSDRIDALLAECEKMEGELREQKKIQIRLYNAGYNAGHEETVETGAMSISQCDMESYHADRVEDLVSDYFNQPKNPKL